MRITKCKVMKSMRVVNMPRSRSGVQTLGRGKYSHTVKMYYLYMIFIVNNLPPPIFPYTLSKRMAMKPYTLIVKFMTSESGV